MILGQSRAGKSGLALELMALGADLVGDDAVELSREKGRIILRRPKNIAGIIEARQVGLLSVPSIEQAGLAIVVDMDQYANERLPKLRFHAILGVDIPLIYGKETPNLGAVLWCLLGEGRLLPTE